MFYINFINNIKYVSNYISTNFNIIKNKTYEKFITKINFSCRGIIFCI